MVEPLAVGLHTVNQGKPGPETQAAVFGCGPIGLAAVCGWPGISGSPTVGTDVFYDLAGAPGIIDQISGLAKFRSRLVVGAIYLNPVPLNFRVLMLREIEMTTVGPYQQDLRDVLAELPEIDPAVLDAYVTGTFPFSEFDNALAIAKQTSSAKVMITFAPADA